MATPSKKQKAKRRVVKSAREKAKKQRRKQRESTVQKFDGMGQLIRSLDERNESEAEDFNQIAARIRRQTENK
jgi:hypothetical protein